jgi:RNA polymerase sigma-70 factor, ECF subfamily
MRSYVSSVDMAPDDGRDDRARPADFDDTFRRWYGPMVRSLPVASGDREVAADCVQDAFERAYLRWRRISRLEDPPGWIRHVAVNRLRDHFRKTSRGRRAVDRLSAEPAPHVNAADGSQSELEALLSALPLQQRVATALFYVEQLSVKEIADAMRLSDGTVKYHLHAARETLRSALEHQR